METVDWSVLSVGAWRTRENAYILGETKVGAALQTTTGKVFTGCNVEHVFRSHDIHAETNAIGNMLSNGETRLLAILVAAQRERFTPCGGCMDWIFQFGGKGCMVAFQNDPNGPIATYTAEELMPHYPL